MDSINKKSKSNEFQGYEGDYGMVPIAEDAFRDKCLARIQHFQQSKGGDETFYSDIDKKFLAKSKLLVYILIIERIKFKNL